MGLALAAAVAAWLELGLLRRRIRHTLGLRPRFARLAGTPPAGRRGGPPSWASCSSRALAGAPYLLSAPVCLIVTGTLYLLLANLCGQPAARDLLLPVPPLPLAPPPRLSPLTASISSTTSRIPVAGHCGSVGAPRTVDTDARGRDPSWNPAPTGVSPLWRFRCRCSVASCGCGLSGGGLGRWAVAWQVMTPRFAGVRRGS